MLSGSEALEKLLLIRVLAGELLELALCQFHAHNPFNPAVIRWPAQAKRLELHLTPQARRRAVLHQNIVRQFHGCMMHQRFCKSTKRKTPEILTL